MFCRRYFAIKSLQRNDMIILGAAALHLAGKAEDDPQRLDKVIHQIFTYRCDSTLARRCPLRTLGKLSVGGGRRHEPFLNIFFVQGLGWHRQRGIWSHRFLAIASACCRPALAAKQNDSRL